jgi:solute:Na+ symporter, SSS family
MSWIDWLIVGIPIFIVITIGLKSQKYVKSVADFLSGRRVAGRYVLSVASGEAAMGLISLVAMYEAMYKSGFAYGFWNSISMPIGIVLGLTGFCIYRFRETRAMTMGQFLEIRYSRSFRILAAILQTISGVLNYSLFPAVGARFMVYYLDLPLQVNFLGAVFPTFALVMAFFLCIAVLISCMGGQITIMVTDCVQGLLSYPMYAVIVGYLIWRFSWFDDLAPVIVDRPEGKSMINPFDISGLRDFNLFYVGVGVFGSILGRMTWSGTQGYNSAAKNAHEQKMAGIISSWRSGFSSLMYTLLAVVAYTYLNSPQFQAGPAGSTECRNTLAAKVFDDVASNSKFDDLRSEYKHYLASGEISPRLQQQVDLGRPQGEADDSTSLQKKPIDLEPMLSVGRDSIRSVSAKESVVFATIFGQLRVPMAIKSILPVGLVGVFCALCIFLMVSTDSTYLHSWGSIIVQDLILPLRGDKPLKPSEQIRLLRILIACVAAFAFVFSLFFGQVDYILMFFAITGAIWTGGAGIVITAGLYWNKGTTKAAFAALIAGSSIATAGAVFQQTWTSMIYPFLFNQGWLEGFSNLMEALSYPFEPYILWRVTPDKFPVNSTEMALLGMLVSITLYVVISLLTCKEAFNMDRMLHRGEYHRGEGKKIDHKIHSIRDLLKRLLGINDEYTRGDKVLTWSVFIYSFGWNFLCCFVGVIIWNMISPWTNEGWISWFFFIQFILGGIIAIISTIWFSWGGTKDLIQLFRDLSNTSQEENDDGRVIGHVSANEADH